MRCISRVVLVLLLFLFVVANARADIVLYEWATNINGTVASHPDLGSGIGLNGLGSFTLTYNATSSGSYWLLAFLDYEIDEETNTFYNEYGSVSVSGTPAAGQSWEIDEPGWVFGDIYTNFSNNALDNTVSVGSLAPDDVSMAMGWNVVLNAGETATATFTISDTAPSTGFYLQQTDPDSGVNIYLSSGLTVRTTGVPEPAGELPLLLSLIGAASLAWRRLRRA